MKPAPGVFLLILLAGEGLLAWGLWAQLSAHSRNHLQERQSHLALGIRSVVDSYQRVASLAFAEAIDRPQVVDLMVTAAAADEATRRRARGALFHLLSPTYEHLRAQYVRVLQLVLPDGRSLLRFNRPDLFDDPIGQDRGLIAITLSTGERGQGFENGRVYPGWRYVFPVFQNGRLVGAADFGVSFDAIQHIVQESGDDGTRSRLLVHRGLLEAVTHPSSLDLFKPSLLHPEYVVEDESSPLRHVQLGSPPPPWIARVEARLGERSPSLAAMTAGRSHAEHLCIGLSECYAVALERIPDSEGRTAAYAVSYSPDPEYPLARARTLAAFAAGSLLYLASLLAIRRWLASNRRLRTVSEHMAEGMLVTDVRGHITYANPATCAMLGFTARELRGRDARSLCEHPAAGEARAPPDCPVDNVLRGGAVFTSEAMSFRRRDGEPLRASLVSSPLQTGGRLSGVVILFRDITAEYQGRLRLQQADVAFRHMAEGVLVTDPEVRIRAVNRAFSQITGYEETEILGRNPRVLGSGRHDTAFYGKLWQALSTDGFWQGELWNRRKSGDVYPAWVRITAVRTPAGDNAGYVAVFSDVSDRRRNETRLRELAYRDQLTGLFNRAAFLEVLNHALQRAQRSRRPLALLYLDLDRFKRINDSLGHLPGDALLRQVAQRLRASVREADVVGRLGGDEFVVLLEDLSSREGPARLARKLLEQVRIPFEVDGQPLYVSLSIGISVFPEDGIDSSTLLRNADAAMYLAKHEGRDGYRFFTGAMAAEARQRFELETDLRRALERAELTLHYQPKIGLPDGNILGVEALLRWQHPRLGLLAPGRFLGIAKDAGLMAPLTEQVIAMACRQSRAWKDALGGASPRVAINLDTHVLTCGDLEGILQRHLAAAGITPADLELEILETAMLVEEGLGRQWQRLAEQGFAIAIDDFGVGESSLSRLRTLPFSTLKIDRSFVLDIEHDENDRALIRTVIAMAKTLGKGVLAEGVENETQLRFLYEAGCDAIQGYYFSRPLPAEALLEPLRDGRFARLAQVMTGLDQPAAGAADPDATRAGDDPPPAEGIPLAKRAGGGAC